MRIKLSDNWFIEDEVSGYVVYREVEKVVKDKEEKTKVEKTKVDMVFPVSLERCVEYIVRKNVISKLEEVSLKEYVDTMRKEFDQIMSEVKSFMRNEKGKTK